MHHPLERATPDGVTVFHGGAVWLGPDDTTDAVAVAEGVITAVGPDARALLADAEHEHDLEGGLLVPAFSDGHAHPTFGGMEFQGPRINELERVEDIVEEVGRYAATHPGDGWIMAASYDPSLVEGGAFEAKWLDAVVPDRPVLIRARDYHTIWCNSEALRRSGISAETPEPRLGRIDRYPDGTPLGTLREWHACDLALNASPGYSLEQRTLGLKTACESMNRYGVTWMQDAWVEQDDHLQYLELLGRGELTVRSNLAFRADPDHWHEQTASFAQMRAEVEAAGRPDLLTARTVKFFADGVIESGTADMLEPYEGTDDHGMPVWSRDELINAVVHFDALGYQTHIHAIGDAAIRHSLDAIERAIVANPAWDRRPVITHVQIVDPADLERFAALGVVACFQSYWAKRDGLMDVLTAPRLGEERTDRQYPMRTLLDMGTKLSIASDWPVSTNDPLEAIAVGAHRINDSGLPTEGWVPGERLPLERGLEAATIGSAYQGYTDAARGSIEVGKAADLVWFDRDFTQLPPLRATEANVRATWLDGRVVYAADPA